MPSASLPVTAKPVQAGLLIAAEVHLTVEVHLMVEVSLVKVSQVKVSQTVSLIKVKAKPPPRIMPGNWKKPFGKINSYQDV
ncbi:hypothetical protein [Endozoicomonas sp. GU-1]|uniref:hypothetical protein n=1 Tax=Endozoicomonas sp. GU-1 TaxID=3009078 RepID=UPI0022B4DA64|nr:hypothetical protein [Endozoicomonas sp. GU-1]WBA80946.1 hypothetical protein O2T12_22000 [Endozoicomonas sp. GU-1]